jgi:quercetin dioxygenase-like cupin family protein
MATTAEPKVTRRKLEFFHFDEAPPLFESGMLSAPIEYPESVTSLLDQMDFSKLMAGAQARVLFRQPGDGGFSLVHVRFGPDYILNRHKHNTECTYYIIAGEVSFGRTRLLREGDGFFVAADQPYGYTAGPEGVELLEFRHASSFTSRVVEDNEAAWKEIFRVADTHQDSWATFTAETGSIAGGVG